VYRFANIAINGTKKVAINIYIYIYIILYRIYI